MTLFAREEYLDRIARTKRRMEAEGIEVLLVASPAESVRPLKNTTVERTRAALRRRTGRR